MSLLYLITSYINPEYHSYLVECSVGEELKTEVCLGSACSWTYSSQGEIIQGNCITKDLNNSVIVTLTTEMKMVKNVSQRG